MISLVHCKKKKNLKIDLVQKETGYPSCLSKNLKSKNHIADIWYTIGEILILWPVILDLVFCYTIYRIAPLLQSIDSLFWHSGIYPISPWILFDFANFGYHCHIFNVIEWYSTIFMACHLKVLFMAVNFWGCKLLYECWAVWSIS